MRPSSIALIAGLLTTPASGCDKDAASPTEHKPTEPPPQIKKPIDKTPLPALAHNQAGATGKPL